MNRLQKPIITKEDVLNGSNNGLEIYQKVVNLKRKGSEYVGLCPFHSERTPSFKIFGNKNSYKCFSCSEGGIDAIKFLMEYYKISFKEALEMAEKDFNIAPSKIITKLAPIKKEMVIDFEDIPFTKSHKAYWNKYLLPEEYLRRKNVFAVGAWAINGVKQKIGDEEILFCYHATDIDKCKLLKIGPNVEKKDKWKSNIESSYLWNYTELEGKNLNNIWVEKSYKDLLVLNYFFGIDGVAVQSENAKVLENNIPRIKELSDNIIINFGSDKQGIEQCKLVQEKFNTLYYNTPKYLLQYDICDPADVIAEFGVDILKQHLIKKQLL